MNGKRSSNAQHPSLSLWTYNWICVGWIRVPFSLICKTAFDSKCAHYTSHELVCVCVPFLSLGMAFKISRLRISIGRAEEETGPYSGWVTRVMLLFSFENRPHQFDFRPFPFVYSVGLHIAKWVEPANHFGSDDEHQYGARSFIVSR